MRDRAPELSPRQIIQAHEWCQIHVEVLARNEDGSPKECRYRNGTGDQDLQSMLGGSVTFNQAKRIRQKLCGSLYQRSREPSHEATLRISGLTSELAMAVKYLADKLGEDAVAKVAHRVAQDLTQAED